MRSKRENILNQRERLLRELPKIPGTGKFLGGAASNFLLLEILDKPRDRGGKPCNEIAMALYQRLAESQHIVVRFRGKELGCEGCLRITVGTGKEVDHLLEKMSDVLADLLKSTGGVKNGRAEEVMEEKANSVIA